MGFMYILFVLSERKVMKKIENMKNFSQTQFLLLIMKIKLVLIFFAFLEWFSLKVRFNGSN
jgi:hypothetical protein